MRRRLEGERRSRDMAAGAGASVLRASYMYHVSEERLPDGSTGLMLSRPDWLTASARPSLGGGARGWGGAGAHVEGAESQAVPFSCLRSHIEATAHTR